MPSLSRRQFIAVSGAALVAPHVAFAEAPLVSVGKDGVAIQGYDSHAYWSLGAPQEGVETHVVVWKGAPWHFATAEDAALFAGNPDSYAPRFGGFCTRAMSLRKVVDGDPEVWRIFEGALYLFAKPVGGRYFDKGQVEMIAKAQAHWDKLHGTGGS